MVMREVDAYRDCRHDACEPQNQLRAFAHACSANGTLGKTLGKEDAMKTKTGVKSGAGVRMDDNG